MNKQTYCIHCKAKVEIPNEILTYYKNGTPVGKGTCKVCGSKVNRMYTREERLELKERSLKGEKI